MGVGTLIKNYFLTFWYPKTFWTISGEEDGGRELALISCRNKNFWNMGTRFRGETGKRWEEIVRAKGSKREGEQDVLFLILIILSLGLFIVHFGSFLPLSQTKLGLTQDVKKTHNLCYPACRWRIPGDGGVKSLVENTNSFCFSPCKCAPWNSCTV